MTAIPPAVPIALPRNVRERLTSLARKHLLVRIARFPALVIGVLPGLWLVQALTDFIFTLPWMTRLVLLIADGAFVAWLLHHHVLLPMRNRLTLRTAALLVERTFPQFRTSLISAVEFTSGVAERSGELVQVLLGQVGRLVDQTDLVRGVVDMRSLRRLLLICFAAAAGMGGVAWSARPGSWILLRRVFLSQEELPRRTTVVPISTDFTINTGTDIELSARAEGVIPRTGRLVVMYADGREETIAVTESPLEPGVFSAVLRNILQPFRYRFELNDGAGSEFQVTTRTLPSLASTRFVFEFPGYTGRPSAELSAGNLTVLAGGKLIIEGEATQPLRSATLELKGLDQKLQMDGGDSIANLHRRVKMNEKQLAEAEVQVSQLSPPAATAEEAMAEAQRGHDTARKALDKTPDGDEKRKRGSEFERAANLFMKARGEREQAKGKLERAQRELEGIQHQLDARKQEMEKALADYKAPAAEMAEKQRKMLRSEVQIPSEGLTGLSLHLVNEQGLDSENDPVYRVNIQADKPPLVTLSEPKSDQKTVLAGDEVFLKFGARDDFGIKKLSLKYIVLRPNPDGDPVPASEGEIQMKYPEGAVNVSGEYLWRLSTFVPPLSEGCTVTYWIEAADHFTLYSPGAGASSKMSLIVVSPEQKKEEMIEEMKRAAKAIHDLSDRQGKTNQKSDENLRK